MSIFDAVAQGKQHHKEAKKKKSVKRLHRSLTANGLYLVFKERFELKYGEFPMISQNDWHMLNGFVKLCIANGKTGEDIYSKIISIVDNWDELRRIPTHTIKGVETTIPPRPSLSYFLTCRDSLLHNIENLAKEDVFIEHSAKQERKIVIRETVSTKKPTQADIDREYADAEW